MAVKRKTLGNSASKLAELGFDPLVEMVERIRAMKAEVINQESIRDGLLVRLDKNGKEKAYSEYFHMELLERIANLTDKLTKFGYAPVKDEEQEREMPSLNIVLHSDNSSFTLNPKKVEEDDG